VIQINQHFLTIIDRTDVPDLFLSEVQMDDVKALDIHKAVRIDEIPTKLLPMV